MGQTLVLGVGNLIMSDDGFGIHVIRRLEETVSLPEEVQVLDGGTAGLDLLYYLEGLKRLIIIDAVEMQKPAGTLTRMVNDEIPAYLSIKMSPHDVGLSDMLFAAKLRDLHPEEVIVLGVQPGYVDMGLELSPEVLVQVDVVVGKIQEELAKP
jgi:hydrogenase maturation protease